MEEGSFVQITPNFPEQCRHVLEALGEVYHQDQLARERGLSRVERLHFHQQHSRPVMNDLHQWLDTQLKAAYRGSCRQTCGLDAMELSCGTGAKPLKPLSISDDCAALPKGHGPGPTNPHAISAWIHLRCVRTVVLTIP
jgi:hypothetical protein